MLIVIDNSICDVINNGDYKVLASLENIAECIRTGKHIVIADRKTCKAICKHEKLGFLSQRAFKELSLRITEIGDIKNEVDGYILITNEVSSITKTNDGNKKVFKVPTDYFYENEKLLPTNLVSEDLSDCQLYEAMIGKYIKGKKHKCRLNFRYVNGGGLNTYLNYENSLIQEQAPCLVIVDSDKKYDNDEYGETARNVLKKYENLRRKYVTGYYILNVREKENMIPPNLYSFVSDDETLKSDLYILDKISKNNKLKEVYKYGDIKSGIKASELIKVKSSKNILKEYLETEILKLLKNDDVDVELLNHIGEKLDSICKESVFAKTVKEICGGENHDCNIRNILDYGFNCIDEEKANEIYFINGINRLIKKVKEIAIDTSMYEKLKIKKELYSKYNTKSLKDEVDKLENQIETIDKFYDNLPYELKAEWNKLAQSCITWGCSVKFKSVS